ncbi:hypothetical protein FRC09_006781, partial [Ceratobasidium sp. 395]
ASPLPPCRPSPTPRAPSPNPRAHKRCRCKKILGTQTRQYSRVPNVPNLSCILRKARREAEEPLVKKQKINARSGDPTPLPPSGGTIDIHSSNPPVVSSSKHPVAISSSDTIGPEDTNPGLRIVSAKKAKVVVFPTVSTHSRRKQQ